MIFFFNTFVFSQESAKRIEIFAVLPFSGFGLSDDETAEFTESLRYELQKVTNGVVLSRSKIISELNLSKGERIKGLFSNYIDAGKRLGATTVIGGRIVKFGKLFVIKTRVIDVTGGKVKKYIESFHNGLYRSILRKFPWRIAAVIMAIDEEEILLSTKGREFLRIATPETGARIEIDGERIVGVTPLNLWGLREGEHLIAVRDGIYYAERLVNLDPYIKNQIFLVPSADSSNLFIYSIPESLDVYLDGEKIGKSPMNYYISDREQVYRISLMKDGYIDYEEDLAIKDSGIYHIFARLESAATLSVNSNPQGAKIFLNDVYFGETPFISTRIPYGRYIIEVAKETYKSDSRIAILTPERPHGYVTFNLEKKGSFITITGEPEGVPVYLDGNFLGKIPIRDKSIAPGKYTISSRIKGYSGYSKTITVTEKESVYLKVQLNRRSPKVAVILSSLIPGSGQIYSGYKLKGLGFFISGILSISSSSLSAYLYKDALDDYNAKKRELDELESGVSVYQSELDNLSNAVNSSYGKLKRRELILFSAISLSAAFWGYNIYDAWKGIPEESKFGKVSLRERLKFSPVPGFKYGISFSLTF